MKKDERIIKLKKERVYRPLIPMFEELYARIETLEERTKPKKRGRPRKVTKE